MSRGLRVHSDLAEHAAFLCKLARLPSPELEYVFAPPRRFRFDLAWPEQLVAVEVHGGHWTGGRHTRPQGFAADCEKHRLAVLRHWFVLPFTGEDIRKRGSMFIETVREALFMNS